MFVTERIACVIILLTLSGSVETGDNVELALQRKLNTILSTQVSLQTQLQQANQGIAHLQTQIDEIQRRRKNIAFYAYLSKDLVNPADGTTVVFDVAETNVGGAYDAFHGVFQAPINGSYHFHFIGSSPENSNPGHVMHLFIVKNGKKEAYAFLDRNTNHWLQSSMASVIHLVKSDRVWVRVEGVAGSHVLAGHRSSDNASHTHFSGFLIQAD